MTTEVIAKARVEYITQISEAFTGGIRAVIDTGNLLIAAKKKLKHGQFLSMIESDLPFGKRAAQTMMAICSDARLTNTQHVALLPPAWGTLNELSQLHDDEFERGIADGVIRPEMTRSEAKKLRALPGHIKAQESGKQETKPQEGACTATNTDEVGDPRLTSTCPDPHYDNDFNAMQDSINTIKEHSRIVHDHVTLSLDALHSIQKSIEVLKGIEPGRDDLQKAHDRVIGARRQLLAAEAGALTIELDRFCEEVWQRYTQPGGLSCS